MVRSAPSTATASPETRSTASPAPTTVPSAASGVPAGCQTTSNRVRKRVRARTSAGPKATPPQQLLASDGKAGDKTIASLKFDPPAQSAELDQHGCHYVPHIMGVQVNQNFIVVNSDATTHNVNVDAKLNDKFNQSQPIGSAPITKQFKRAETVIPVKCNQHPWMRAYVGVLAHPFFAVTDKDGHFEIKGVPPGTYTVVAWHEKYPQGLTQTVTVAPSEHKEQNFTFTQLTAENVEGGSLLALPALEIPMPGMGQQ